MTRIITKSQLKQIILEESRRTVMDNILLETKMTLRHLCEAEGVTTGEACDLKAIQAGEQKVKEAEAASTAAQAVLGSIKGGANDPVANIMQAVLVQKVGLPMEEWFEADGSLKAEVAEKIDEMASDDSWKTVSDALGKAFKGKGTNLEEYFGAAKLISGGGAAGSFITGVYKFFTETKLPSMGFKGLNVGYNDLQKVDLKSLSGWKDILTGETTQSLLPSVEGGEIFLTDPTTGERVKQITDLIGGTGWLEASVYLGIAAACFWGLQKLFKALRPAIDAFKNSAVGKWTAEKISLSADWIKAKIGEGIVAARPHVKKAMIYLKDNALKYIKIGWEKLKQACGNLASKALSALDPQSQPNDSNNQKELKEGMSVPTLEEIRSLRMWLTFLKEHNTKQSH